MTDTKLNRQTTAPAAAPDFVGQTYALDSTNAKALFVAAGTSAATDWKAIAAVPTEYAGDPNGNVTVVFAGQQIIDTSNSALYVALASEVGGTTWSTSFAAVGGY